ncbi:MAG: hypothetical protein IKF79_07420, partial [Methanosphaera sp.]|nr:hypothetical protein [Methanosphaera sp.]
DNVTLTGNVFTCNNAEVGGAVYINNSRTILENNTFTGNGLNNPVRLIQTLTGNYTTSNMTQLGACIYINGSVVEINNDTYTNNTASVHASCIYSKDSLILINNTVFEDNNANTGVGGAVYSDESTLFIYNSQLSNNSALVGGAITQAGSNDLTIRNTILTDNSADKCGGAVYVINSPVVLVNNTITGNTADNASSLCVLSSPIGSIKDNLFDNSQCDTSSVYLFESNLLVESNTFIGDNIDLNDMGLYSIESNYWGSNQPDFNTRTGNNIPNSITTVNSTDEYNIYLTVPGTVKNNRTIAVNISIQNQYNENVTEGSVRLEINDTLESVIACTDGFFAYNLTITEGSVGSIVIKATYIDSNDVETDLNIFKTVKIISPEEIYIVSIPQRAIPNEKIQFVVKILKEDNTFISNRKVRAYINNTYIGTFKVSNEKYLLNYTVPSSYHGLYNIKLSCRDTNLKELTSKNITFFVESNTTRVVDVDDLNIDYNLENITLPASYDIRDDGVMVDFENQGDSGNCWAFSVLDCLEYSLNKQSNITCDFSENNMKNLLSTNAIFKSDRTPNTGCDIVSSVGYLVSRLGPVYEYNDPYWMYSQLSVNQNSDYNVNDVLFISNRQNTSDNMELKKAIYQYGAVVSTLHINEETTEISDIHDDEFHLPN